MARGSGRWGAVAGGAALTCILLGAGARADDVAAEPSEVLAAPAPGETSVEGFNLARLAELERLQGNGGQEEGPSVLAGWDAKDGFYIKDKEGLYKLVISGRVQIRYTYKGRDQRGEDETADEVGDEDDSFLELERARFKLKGFVLSPRLEYEFQIDGDSDDSGQVELLDYFVLYNLVQDEQSEKSLLSIGAGQHKSYFLRQEATSSGKLAFPDRSLANEFFNIDRNLAAWLQGDLGPVFYALEVANGFDSINRSGNTVDQIPALVAKVDFNILGNYGYEESGVKCTDEAAFVIGGSFATDQNNNSSGLDEVDLDPVTPGIQAPSEYKVYQFGLDTGFRWSIFNIQAEYMGRWLDVAEDGEGTAYAHGFYVQSGVFLYPNVLELAGRVSVIYGNEGENTRGTGIEAGPGLNWFISKSHKVKLQTYVLYFDIPTDLPVQTESLDGSDLNDFSSFSSSAANLQAGEQGIMIQTQLNLDFG